MLAPALPRLRPAGRSPLSALSLMSRHAAERAALARLGDAALDDLGLTRAQAAREAARPFWDVSPHRR